MAKKPDVLSDRPCKVFTLQLESGSAIDGHRAWNDDVLHLPPRGEVVFAHVVEANRPKRYGTTCERDSWPLPDRLRIKTPLTTNDDLRSKIVWIPVIGTGRSGMKKTLNETYEEDTSVTKG